MVATHRLRIQTGAPFDWRLAVWGHGWAALAPFAWDADRGVLEFPVEHEGLVVDVRLRHRSPYLLAHITSPQTLSAASRSRLRARLVRMVRLDEDFRPFWRMCRAHGKLAWVARLGAGRLLRAPSLFEDQLKILFTTNCTWGNTRSMSARLVDLLGRPGPSGRKAFPTAARCARRTPAWWRDVMRVGYRAAACAALCQMARRDDNALDPAGEVMRNDDLGALRAQILARPGFGPYAAGQTLRLLGHYEDLALDAAVRARLGPTRSDADYRRRYAPFGPFAGLALWMDFSACWLDHPGIPGR